MGKLWTSVQVLSIVLAGLCFVGTEIMQGLCLQHAVSSKGNAHDHLAAAGMLGRPRDRDHLASVLGRCRGLLCCSFSCGSNSCSVSTSASSSGSKIDMANTQQRLGFASIRDWGSP